MSKTRSKLNPDRIEREEKEERKEKEEEEKQKEEAENKERGKDNGVTKEGGRQFIEVIRSGEEKVVDEY